MVNVCSIIITKGINKGKTCSEVHKWCKHNNIFCSICKKTFSYKHSYDSHKCKSKVPIAIQKKTVSATQESTEKYHKYQEQYQEQRIRHQEQLQQQFQKQLFMLQQKHEHEQGNKHVGTNKHFGTKDSQDMMDMLVQIKDEIEELKNAPKNNIYMNFAVIGDDMYKELIERMGSSEGNRFIMDTAMAENYDGLIDCAYPPSSKGIYPIACKDKYHFRFLDDRRNIIDDMGGNQIMNRLTKSIQNTMLKANADIIGQYVSRGNTDTLYNEYDMRAVQEKISDLTRPKQQNKFKHTLASKMSNPEHPFFKITKI